MTVTSYRTLDPSTEQLAASFDLADAAAIDSTLRALQRGFLILAKSPVERRSLLLGAIADALQKQSGHLAGLMALEMGKPLNQGKSEAEKCAWVCRYYAENARRFLSPEPRDSDGSEAFVRYEPLGLIFAIMPWNFPLWQVFRFVAPALAAGNTGLLKHSPNTPQCALAIEELVTRCTEQVFGTELTAAKGTTAFANLFLSNEQAAQVIAREEVRGVTLTGSSAAGRAVASTAGKHLKPTVLELGGSDAFIVLEDADIEKAVATGVLSRCLNSGQSCIAAKRFLVADKIHDEFEQRFVTAMNHQRVGDPREPATEIGPLARADLRDTLAEQVERARGQGAKALCGGEPSSRKGFFFPPTVLVGLNPESSIAGEEFFGPVAILYRFAHDAEAITLANATDFGLGASLWTSDRKRAEAFVEGLESGSVFVNGLVKSDPRLPFGGIRDSGYGRELSVEGLRAFVNQKTVWVA